MNTTPTNSAGSSGLHIYDQEMTGEHACRTIIGILTSLPVSTCRSAAISIWTLNRERLAKCPASWTKHHAFEGGLALHTLEVMTICSSLIHNPVSIIAAALHDIAKVAEYMGEQDKMNAYRREIGHVSGAVIAFTAAVSRKNDAALKGDLFEDIVHCLLSHHGRASWGSPVEPASREAMALHYADMHSSRFPYFTGPKVEESAPQSVGPETPAPEPAGPATGTCSPGPATGTCSPTAAPGVKVTMVEGVDFGEIEARVMKWLSERGKTPTAPTGTIDINNKEQAEDGMFTAWKAGLDPYCFLASHMFRLPYSQVTIKMRMHARQEVSLRRYNAPLVEKLSPEALIGAVKAREVNGQAATWDGIMQMLRSLRETV